MNWALWKKAVSESWLLLAAGSGLLFFFAWVFVWFTSLFQVGAFGALLQALPAAVQALFPVPINLVATPAGQISVVFAHPISMIVCVGWAVGRGSASISGEIGHGTMDLILTLPVRRVSVLLVPAVVTALETALLVGALWAGIGMGLQTVRLASPVPGTVYFHGALNLYAMTFCLTGITALLSAGDQNRWRTMSLAGGLFVVSLLIDLVARVWKSGEWIKYLSFLTAFKPQMLSLAPETLRASPWQYHAVLLILGVLCYVAAALILVYRDIPQPR